MKISSYLLWVIALLTLCSAGVFLTSKLNILGTAQSQKAQLNTLRFCFEHFQGKIDPNHIVYAGEWYFLNHVFSPLLQYDHKSAQYVPLLAESWSIDGNSYTFKLRADAKFHDGSPITARDVAATIKRIVVEKTVTHFPLWEYLSGCDKLTSINQNCSGLVVHDDLTISFHLVGRKESFFLALASPETGIWSSKEVESRDLSPKKFSGPYYIHGASGSGLVLRQNLHSPIIKSHSLAPKEILTYDFERDQLEAAVADGRLDLFIGDFIPFNRFDWDTLPSVSTKYTTPSTLIYLAKTRKQLGRAKIGADILKSFWSRAKDMKLMPAETFLPPGSLGVLEGDTILSQMDPTSTSKTIRIAAPKFYFQQAFYDTLINAAKAQGIELVIDPVDKETWQNLLEEKYEAGDRWDYVLSTYVASERFPAVQLRYLLHGKPHSEAIWDFDSPDETPERRETIRDYEKWLVNNHYILPMYLLSTHVVYQKNLDIGDQPVTDAEIQLWKVTADGKD